MSGPEPPPWAALPREVSDAMRPHLGEIVERIIKTIQRDVPAYARPLEGDFLLAVQQGVQVAVARLLLDLPGRTDPALAAEDRQVYTGLGKGEARSGRPMEALLAAYRTGARVAFREVSRIAAEEGLPPTVLLPMGESIFVYIDELSSASIEAFTAEQFRRAGERDRRRAALLDQMVSGRAEAADIRPLASAAGWTIPRAVVVFVLPADRGEGLRIAADERVLLRSRYDQVIGLVAAPNSGRARRELSGLLADRRAWVGPARPWERAHASLAAAQAAHAMPTQPGDGGPWWVTEHLSSLMLQAQPDLMDDLAARRLAPMDGLKRTQRARLAQTLLSWLSHQGERGKVAADLHIHPQTVGYRVGQLRDVFGDELDDPDVRFQLEMVLRAGHS